MKTRYKISIIATLFAVTLFSLFSFYYAPIICDDVIFQLDGCHNYLEEKYAKLPVVQHFMSIYPEAAGLGYSTGMFRVQTVYADAMLADKVFAHLEIDLHDSSIVYACSNHNKGEDYLISRIANPTIDDLDGNNCRTLNQIKAISKWDFRSMPSYVIIPKGAVIEGNEYLIPKEITVVLGKNSTVTWSNEDDVAHALVSNDKNNPWATGLMRPGESSSVKFNSTGIFNYHGAPGPWITGTVIVLEN